MGFLNFLNRNEIYKPADIDTVLDMALTDIDILTSIYKISYYNVPCAFDIEASSFYALDDEGDQEKVGIMYEWTFGINGLVIIGRTWQEFITMLEAISAKMELHSKQRLLCYVHNLGFDFQFMRKWLHWDKVFSVDERRPVYALSSLGIEFRCSYILSGYSLEKIGENLVNYQVQKMVGDLDYKQIRHYKTPLTEKEIGYCVNDVKIVMAYIQESIERNHSILHIPLTKTGYVRRYCRNSCFYDYGIPRSRSYKRLNYRRIMNRLRLTEDEYYQLKRAFQGGFTHTNPFCSGKVMTDVTSFDLISSYPSVMIAEQFPMDSSEVIEVEPDSELFERSLQYYCCLFDIAFVGLESIIYFENYISLSRCDKEQTTGVVVNNGRVVKADTLVTTITEQDFLIIRKFYKWKKYYIKKFRRYKKGYLPTDFVKAILKLYGDKTKLKGVEGKEIEYMASKEMANASFGMTVTDPAQDDILYLDDKQKWDMTTPNIEKKIIKYNNSQSRFLFFPWGVWVCAYGRRNLFSGILEFAEDYLYSDTDSLKVINAERHMNYINEYNQLIRDTLIRAMHYHKLNPALIEPLTQKGEKKCLGLWDFDGHYSRFKALRAKAYLVEYSHDQRNKPDDRGRISMTVSGLRKQTCVPYMLSKWGREGIFRAFSDYMYIPAQYTGKKTHTYIDVERKGMVTDYMGLEAEYDELSAVHMEEAEYKLSLGKDYRRYLGTIKTKFI